MTHGFSAQNNAGQVLISDQTRNLHFLGKALSISFSADDFAGGLRQWVFRISSMRPLVPFFTAHPDLTAITTITESSANVWDIGIVRAGTDNTTPEVYVFTDPIGRVPEESHGMVVFDGSGSPTFDSRLIPLSITWGATAVSPNRPFDNGISAVGSNLSTAMGQQTYSAGMSEQFRPKNTAYVGNPPAMAKPLLSFSALMQSEVEQGFADELTSGGTCSGDRTTTYYRTLVWGFYRSAIGLNSGCVSGWITVSHGGFTTSERNTYDQVSQSSNSTGRAANGVPPLSNETINTRYSTVMMTDGIYYD